MRRNYIKQKIRVACVLVKSFVLGLQLELWRGPRKQVIKGIPYYSQWESKKLVRGLLSKRIKAEDDPLWKNSGAATKLEYTNWSWNACGMACLQMIYAYKTGRKIPLVQLCKRSLGYGCYLVDKYYFDKGEFLKSLPGLFYKPFVRFVQEEFGLTGKISLVMVIPEIISQISLNKFVIASVHGNIRDISSESKKGGHLVLVLGYDLVKKVFYVHNPSGLYGRSQKYSTIGFADFERYFDYKGIIIS